MAKLESDQSDCSPRRLATVSTDVVTVSSKSNLWLDTFKHGCPAPWLIFFLCSFRSAPPRVTAHAKASGGASTPTSSSISALLECHNILLVSR